VANGRAREALRELAGRTGAGLVLDLSGEPVLVPERRLELAAVALDVGLEYRAAGFRLAPPPQERLGSEVPIVSVIGTGKRTGKTALGGHLAALLRDGGLDPVVVSMGRGGPAEPRVVGAEETPALAELLEIARRGEHAASDYIEDAVLARVTTVGCRRCGESPAGETFESNVVEGARLALSLDPGVVVLEGSGAAFPPVAAHRTVCVTHAARARGEALAHLGPLRLMRSQLTVVVGADEISAAELEELKRELGDWCGGPVIGCELRPEPADPLEPGTSVAAFTTAPPHAAPLLRERLEGAGLAVRVFSTNLAHREQLTLDAELAAREGCEVFLTELKAAAIEVVAEQAQRAGARIVFLRNRPVPAAGEAQLDEALRELVGEARREARAHPAPGAGP
jgi:cyclic 2,3-diphosphoglycerate synthetase